MKFKQLLLIFTLVFIGQNIFAQDEATLVKEGALAPDFSIVMKDGSQKKLSDLKGKVVWINFFATWCPPCRKELPHLQKAIYEKLKNNKNFELLIIGREHDWAEVDKFKTDNNYIMPFYPDKNREIFAKYAAQNIPRNFIIDKNGEIVVSSIGYKEDDFNKMVEKVNALLKK